MVSPLFESWNLWLGSNLSQSMLKNMKSNLQEWENTQPETPAPPAPAPPSVEVEQTSLSPPAISSESDADSSGSVLGSLQCLYQSVSRRHSLPLSVLPAGPLPATLPRTVMRRQSVPNGSGGGAPMLMQTVVVGDMVMGSLTPGSPAPHAPLTPESLLPDPSIATMGGVGRGGRRRVGRRASLPPLWPQRARPAHTLMPMPPTPTPPQEDSQDCQNSFPLSRLPSEEVEERLRRAGGSNERCRLDNCSSTGETPVGNKNGMSGNELRMVRRASLDSCPGRGMRDSNGNVRNNRAQDKENWCPVGDRPPALGLCGTRLWRSLNYDDENTGPLDNRGGKPPGPSIYRIQSQVCNCFLIFP